MAETDLAIIGGGASAVLLLAAIARQPGTEGFRADVYDRSGSFGRGIAYSTPHKVHLLNVRAGNMSAHADDRDDFANWAAVRGYATQDFVPRMLYGEYLDEKLEEAKTRLTLNLLKGDVESVKNVGKDAYELTTGMKKRSYTMAVQATGNVQPIRPKVDSGVAQYIDDPWSADYTALSAKAHIGLIGSGLTAVDSILALYAKNFGGKISVFSRHGLFPATHAAPVPLEPFLPVEGEQLSPYAALRLVRQKVKDAASQNIPWQAVIDALRPHTNIVWEGWRRREREKFMKRCFTLWNIHRHRMAPQIAELLQALQDAGRIETIHGAVLNIAPGPVVKSEAGNFPCDAVINCMGYRTREEGHSFEVFDKIGPARFGEQLETTAIPEIRAQAAEIAARILTRY